MAIAEACKGSFPFITRDRGRDYFESGSVRIREARDGSITTDVSGSRRSPYRVEIGFSRTGERQFSASCTCPHYDDGFLCKHIWATLLQIDQQRLVDGFPAGRAHVLHEAELNDGGWEYYDDDREDDGEDWETDDWDDEEIDTVAGPSPLRPTGGIEFPRLQRRGLGRAGGTSNWKGALDRVAQYGIRQAMETHGVLPGEGKQREAWFIFDVGASFDRGQVIVKLRQRETNQKGAFGKIKKLSVRANEVPEFTAEEDRRLVELLIGNQAGAESPYGYYNCGMYGPSISQVALAPGMYEFLLPRLCATGRFVWQLDASVPAEQEQRIAWDDGEAWRFRLRVDDDKRGRKWRLSGQLHRGGEEVPLSEPVILMGNGVVLFAEKIARLAVPLSDFGWIVNLRAHAALEVPYSQRDRLLKTLYRLPKLPEVDWPPTLRVEHVEDTPRGHLKIKSPKVVGYYSSHELYASASFLYGDHEFSGDDAAAGLFDGKANRALVRDRQQEAALLEQLAELKLRPARSGVGEFDLRFPSKRLPEVVSTLTGQGWQVEADGVRIRQPGSLHLSVTSGVDWFELDGKVDFEGVSASLPDLLKALRSKEKYVRLDDGSQGMLPEEWLRRHGHLVGMAQDEEGALRFAPSQALLLDALLAEQENVRVDRAFAALRKKLTRFEGVKPAAEPRGFHGKLRAYQKEGLGWLHFLREFGFGGCLADDMGLGKTVQVLALLQSRRLRRPKADEPHKPSIVVVPKSLVFNWLDEAARFAPKLRTLNYTGTDRKSRLAEADGFDVVVTTYGTLRRDISRLKDVPFDYAILDESQAIKNHTSQAAKAARLLQAEHRLAMTGTPVENHFGELWSLFEFLNPGMLGRSTAFEALAQNGKQEPESVAQLGRGLRPFLLRRTKEQVLTELPEKTEQTLYCEMPAKQRKAYNALCNDYRARLSDCVSELGLKRAKIHVLEALLRMRQAACHPGLLDAKQKKEPGPKLELLLEQLQEVIAEGHKALVFSQFTSLLSIVRQHLDAERMVYEYLDGRTRRRAEKVKRFQSDAECPVFLISLKAGGHGLNLTAADYVFILDPWWNPAVESQAIDRAHRIGQTRRVFAYRIICRDTVEERILELQETKRDLADAIVSADNSLIRSLTPEDLELLLS